MFAFAGCNDDEEELPPTKYTIKAWFADFSNIYIHEYNENGDKLKTNRLYSLKCNEAKTYTAEKGCKEVHVYAKCRERFIAEKHDWIIEGEDNSIGLNPASVISEEEYNFFIK